MITPPETNAEARDLFKQLQAHEQSLSAFIDDNESDWTDDAEQRFRDMQAEADAMVDALESFRPNKEEHPFAARFRNAEERKTSIMSDAPSVITTSDRQLYLNYAGKQWRGLESKTSNPDLRDMTDAERLQCLGRELRAMATGTPFRPLALATTTSGAAVIQPEILETILPYVFKASVVGRAGIAQIQMDADTVSVPEITSAFSGNWLAEGAALTLATNTISTTDLTARKLVTAFYYTDEAAAAMENVIDANVQLLIQSVADAIDSAFLNGTGVAPIPKGMTAHTNATDGINEIDAAANTTIAYDDLVDGVFEIKENDYDGPMAIVESVELAKLRSKLKDADNRYLSQADVPALDMATIYATTKMPSGSPWSDGDVMAAVFAPSAWLIGIRDDIRVSVSTDAIASDGSSDHNAFAEGKTLVKAQFRGDIACVRPTWHCNVLAPA